MSAEVLVASLTCGGSPTQGVGFAIILVVRYVLETCSRVSEAVAAMCRIPVALLQNVTVLDKSGAFATVFPSPARADSLRAHADAHGRPARSRRASRSTTTASSSGSPTSRRRGATTSPWRASAPIPGRLADGAAAHSWRHRRESLPSSMAGAARVQGAPGRSALRRRIRRRAARISHRSRRARSRLVVRLCVRGPRRRERDGALFVTPPRWSDRTAMPASPHLPASTPP